MNSFLQDAAAVTTVLMLAVALSVVAIGIGST